jgi:SAM-dependent methyltransferase
MSKLNKSYKGWDTSSHLETFDLWNKKGNLEFNFFYGNFAEQRYLLETVARLIDCSILDVGCATATTYRYLRNKLGKKSYRYKGVDLSKPVLDKAIRLYPEVDVVQKANENLYDYFGQQFDVVFSRDTILHQTEPYKFIQELMDISKNALILRLRTRDNGKTELDIDKSCQRHYDKFWMPYVVLNIDELISFVSQNARLERITINKEYQILGGTNQRYLPKELYSSATGGAETSLLLEFSDKEIDKVKIINDSRLQGHAFAKKNRIYAMICALQRRIIAS